MNILPEMKIEINSDLDTERIASKIANIILSFRNNNFFIDYKTYEKLKELSLETQSIVTFPPNVKVLKIRNNHLNVIFYVSTVNSDYLSIDKFIELSRGLYYEKNKSKIVNINNANSSESFNIISIILV